MGPPPCSHSLTTWPSHLPACASNQTDGKMSDLTLVSNLVGDACGRCATLSRTSSDMYSVLGLTSPTYA